jgi:hypothetical protein
MQVDFHRSGPDSTILAEIFWNAFSHLRLFRSFSLIGSTRAVEGLGRGSGGGPGLTSTASYAVPPIPCACVLPFDWIVH